MEKIRKATFDDVKQLKKIKPSLTAESIIERLKKQGEGLLDYLILEKDGEILSFILLKWRGKRTHPEYPDMEDLFTRKDQRTKGYATRLIKECEKSVKERGFKKIGLAVNPRSNKAAQKLYEEQGYSYGGGESYIDGIYDGIKDWVVDLEKTL